MKTLLAITLLGACATFALPAAAATATATTATATANPQQERMKSCNTKAAGMKGDERKKYMSDCLSADKKADNKMSACNTKSKGMKGDERKKFMSDCLKAAS